ncbi:MAG: universal stress protein, partial [Methanoregula sp.]|nr:universal stress protein [Methanoregula sp.]
MFEKILIPTDLSENSEKLVSCADSIRNVREIVLLHIVPAGKNSGESGDLRVQEQEAVQKLERLVKNPGTTVRCIVAEDA